MKLAAFKQKFLHRIQRIQEHYWPNTLTYLESKSSRRWFLHAIILGLLISVPWQAAKLIHRNFSTESASTTVNTTTPLNLPNDVGGSITTMPRARAPRAVFTPLTSIPAIVPHTEPNPPTATATEDLNQEAKPLQQVAPQYPASALRTGVSGTVIIKVTLDEQGNPTAIDIAESSKSRVLDRAAYDAVAQWQFSPKIENGKAVATEILIPIEFKPE